MVDFGQCSEKSDNVLTILVELIRSMGENVGESSRIFGKDNLPVTRVRDLFPRDRLAKSKLNISKFLGLALLECSGVHGREYVVEASGLPTNDVIPVLRGEDGTIRLGLDRRSSNLGFSCEILEDDTGFLEGVRELDSRT